MTKATRKPSVERLAGNVLATLELATPEDIDAGRAWYDDARALASELDPNNVPRVAGVIAALSPQASWTVNVNWAIESLYTGVAVGNTPANRAKAQRILDGEDPLEVLGGLKVRAFYANILDPESDAVTIDRHAYDVAVGKRGTDASRAKLARKGMNERFVAGYIHASDQCNIPPAQLQAITWVTWRRINGITV